MGILNPKIVIVSGFLLLVLGVFPGCGDDNCTTNADCGGGLNFCDNGTCRTSPGEIEFLEDAGEAGTEDEGEAAEE